MFVRKMFKSFLFIAPSTAVASSAHLFRFEMVDSQSPCRTLQPGTVREPPPTTRGQNVDDGSEESHSDSDMDYDEPCNRVSSRVAERRRDVHICPFRSIS